MTGRSEQSLESLSERSFLELLDADTELTALCGTGAVCFALADEHGSLTFHVRDASVSLAQPGDEPAFTVRLTATGWAELCTTTPAPRTQSVLSQLPPVGTGEVTGDRRAFAQYLQVLRRIIELVRAPGQQATPTVPDLSAVRGRYLRCRLGDEWANVYAESCGTGPDVLLLATAGSDCRQFHALMADPGLSGAYRLHAVDLPWHGRSAPPLGAPTGAYRMTRDLLLDVLSAAISQLELDRPVLVGSSMAGAAVIEMLAAFPDTVGWGVACQVGPRVRNRRTRWLRDPAVNQTLHVPEWTYGLMNPASPKAYRDQVWWGYSQGGFGIYDGDLSYYTEDWDVDRVAARVDLGRTPLVLLAGAFDYSVPPQAMRELQSALPGAELREMPELGHFPHAENPPVFAGHLRSALDRVTRRPTSERTT